MNVLYEGAIKKDGQETVVPFWVRRLTGEDLTAILRVQELVVADLDNKNILQPLSEEEFHYILDGNGLMIGAFVGNELIAFRALLVPPIDEEHLGLDIGLDESELSQVIYQEISNVLPAYRGNRLQQTLAELIMKEQEKGGHSYRYVCCTVAPFNIPSLKDKFAQGMQLAALKEKYGGLLRYVFVKDLAAAEGEVEADLPDGQETVLIPMADTAAQQQKFAAGWRGHKMEQQQNQIWIHFRRRTTK